MVSKSFANCLSLAFAKETACREKASDSAVLVLALVLLLPQLSAAQSGLQGW